MRQGRHLHVQHVLERQLITTAAAAAALAALGLSATLPRAAPHRAHLLHQLLPQPLEWCAAVGHVIADDEE